MLQMDQSFFKITKSKLIFWTAIYVLASFNKCSAKEVYYDFRIRYFEGAADGVSVQILGVNDQFPGPTIRATKNDILTVKVTNQIQDRQSTTIHWHGLEQYLTPFVDGPRMITQCDIPFNSSFTYRFQLMQSGTYWYHSHHTLQLSEGLWGVLIIDNVPEVYNYDGEFMIAQTPWYHTSAKEQYEWYMDMSKSQGNLPVPDSHLINGVGYYPREYAQRKNMTCDTTNRDRFVMFEVERGKTYRFRYLYPAPLSGYSLSIDKHKFIRIETDGVDTVMSEPVDIVAMSTAQRDSYLITMNGDEDQYWIRISCNMVSLPQANIKNLNPFPEIFLGCSNLVAVLKYINSTTIASTTKSLINTNASQGRPDIHDRELLLEMKKSGRGELLNIVQGKQLTTPAFDELMTPKFAYAPFPTTVPFPNATIRNQYNSSRPVGDERAPNYVNQTIVINVPNQDDTRLPNPREAFNNITYNPLTLDKPALFKSLLGEELPIFVNPIKINGFGSNYVVEVIFNDFGNTGHPIHLHGHTFWVMGRGRSFSGPFTEEIQRSTLEPATRRETDSLPRQSWLVIRFRADNPGVWLLHCHISHHLNIGMGLVLEEGLDEARAIYKIPQESIELCQRNGTDLGILTTATSKETSLLVDKALLAIILLLNVTMMLLK